MKFCRLAEHFEKIENTSSRLAITELISKLVKELSVKETGKVMYILQGRLGPLYEKFEFGMAERMVIRSVIRGLGLEAAVFKRENKRIGDIGKTVEKFKQEMMVTGKSSLEVLEVFNRLKRLAMASGEGSQEKKVEILAGLIRELDPLSSRYLVRIVIGRLRLGFSDMTVLDAFSWMLKGDKSLRLIIEKAYHVYPDLGFIATILKTKGVKGLKEVKPSLFTPILMMRAERLSSSKEIINKIGRCIVEPKYDGFRLQIHYRKTGGKIRLYSRNLEDVTYMYPDIVQGVKKEVAAEEIIFEGEAIGFDPHSGSFLPFQETVQRKRKYGVKEKAKEIPLKLFAFEVLYFNGKKLLDTPFINRRRILEKAIKLSGDIFKDTILLAPEMVTDKEKVLELEFDQAIARGLEGIVAKKLNGIYQPGARGWNWIKFKRSYSSKIEDTIDCLVMGYDYGRGKRADFGIGAFLVGIYDQNEDKFMTVAKIGTGLTDEEWRRMKRESDKYRADRKPGLYEVDKQMEVDVWVKPSIVVEIKADEISRSPVHTAGRRMKPTKTGQALEVDTPGYALRFPRLQRFRRDKRPEEVTTVKEIEEMFGEQFK